MSEIDGAAGTIKDENLKDFNAKNYVNQLAILKLLYGGLDGFTLASSLFKWLSYVTAETPSMAKDVRADTLSDPLGIALVCIDAFIITSISILANTAGKKAESDKNSDKNQSDKAANFTTLAYRQSIHYFRQFQCFLAIVWPYLRLGIKSLKNNQKSIINITKILGQTTKISSSLLNSMVLPLGLTVGVIGLVNSTFYQYHLNKRKDKLKENDKLLQQIRENSLTELSDKKIQRSSTSRRGLALLSAAVQGLTDGLYYQIGMLMFASLVPGGLIAMTAVMSCVITMSVIAGVSREYDEQCKLRRSAIECELALEENRIADADKKIALIKQPYEQAINALEKSIEKIQSDLNAKRKCLRQLWERSPRFEDNLTEDKVFAWTKYRLNQEEISALEKELNALNEKLDALHSGGVEGYLDKQKQVELIALLNKKNTALQSFENKQKNLDDLNRPSMLLSSLSGIAGGMVAFATCGAILYGTSAILTVFSVTFPPALLFTAVAIGFAFTLAYVTFKLYRGYQARKDFEQQIFERDQEKLTQTCSPTLENDVVDLIESKTPLIEKVDTFLFDTFAVAQGAFAGVGKGENLVNIGQMIFNVDNNSSPATTIIVGVATLLLCAAYSATLALRAFGKRATKSVNTSVKQAEAAEQESVKVPLPEKQLTESSLEQQELQACDQQDTVVATPKEIELDILKPENKAKPRFYNAPTCRSSARSTHGFFPAYQTPTPCSFAADIPAQISICG